MGRSPATFGSIAGKLLAGGALAATKDLSGLDLSLSRLLHGNAYFTIPLIGAKAFLGSLPVCSKTRLNDSLPLTA